MSSRHLCIYCFKAIAALPRLNLSKLMLQNKAEQTFLISKLIVFSGKISFLTVVKSKTESDYLKQKNKQSDTSELCLLS